MFVKADNNPIIIFLLTC